jgi:hypothetical protein
MNSLEKHYRRALKSVVRRLFPRLQRLGINLTLNSFYSPIPELAELPSELWSGSSALPGVDLRERQQLDLLVEFETLYKNEYDAFPRTPTGAAGQFHVTNKSFTSVDAEMLYCFIRHFKPARIFEIGSGHSTLLSAQAALKNREETGRACELTACEPYPVERLKRGFPGLTRLLEKKSPGCAAGRIHPLGGSGYFIHRFQPRRESRQRCAIRIPGNPAPPESWRAGACA